MLTVGDTWPMASMVGCESNAARRLIGLVTVCLLSVSGCSSETNLEAAAAEALGAHRADLFFDEQVPLETTGCALAPVWDTTSTNPYPLVFAMLDGGTVVNGFSDETAQLVLDSCFYESGRKPAVETLVEIVVSLARTPGPIAAASPADTQQLQSIGADYQPPAMSTVDGLSTVRFLAVDQEINQFYTVTAEVGPDRFETSFEPLDG